MAKPKLEVYIGARYSEADADNIKQYTKDSHMDQSELVRKAVAEYMTNHPIEGENNV